MCDGRSTMKSERDVNRGNEKHGWLTAHVGLASGSQILDSSGGHETRSHGIPRSMKSRPSIKDEMETKAIPSNPQMH